MIDCRSQEDNACGARGALIRTTLHILRNGRLILALIDDIKLGSDVCVRIVIAYSDGASSLRRLYCELQTAKTIDASIRLWL